MLVAGLRRRRRRRRRGLPFNLPVVSGLKKRVAVGGGEGGSSYRITRRAVLLLSLCPPLRPSGLRLLLLLLLLRLFFVSLSLSFLGLSFLLWCSLSGWLLSFRVARPGKRISMASDCNCENGVLIFICFVCFLFIETDFLQPRKRSLCSSSSSSGSKRLRLHDAGGDASAAAAASLRP